MGLDSVELLIEVEKTFDIQIPDQEAQNIGTVGEFYEVVWNKIKQKESNKCKSAFLFYRIRELLSERYNISSRDIRIDSDLNKIIPVENRKSEWQRIKNNFKFKLPELVLSDRLNTLLNYFGLVTILGGLIVSFILVTFFNATKYYFIAPIAGIILTILFSRILNPFRTNINAQTIREFINEILKLNNQELSSLLGTNRQEMETVMNLVIADKAGVELSEITYNASITNDLGID